MVLLLSPYSDAGPGALKGDMMNAHMPEGQWRTITGRLAMPLEICKLSFIFLFSLLLQQHWTPRSVSLLQYLSSCELQTLPPTAGAMPTHQSSLTIYSGIHGPTWECHLQPLYGPSILTHPCSVDLINSSVQTLCDKGKMSGWGLNFLSLPAQLQGLCVLHLPLLVFPVSTGTWGDTWTTKALSVDVYNSPWSYWTDLTPHSKGITLQPM